MTDLASDRRPRSVEAGTTTDEIVAAVDGGPLRPILRALLEGSISAPVAIMRMLCETESTATVAACVRVARDRAQLAAPDVRARAEALARVASANEDGVARIAAMLAADVDSSATAPSVDHGIAHCERLFDWSVAQSEETSVALYSLGNPEILAEATSEVIALLDRWSVLSSRTVALEIGCGIGRFLVGLGARIDEIHGVDVSTGMVEAARRRTDGMRAVHVAKCSGRDLSMFDDGRFDLVLAVDTFPYLVQSGMPLVERHFEEISRVLRASGDFALFNFSYRDDIAADRADIAHLAATHGFGIAVDGSRALTLWDGVAWHLRKR